MLSHIYIIHNPEHINRDSFIEQFIKNCKETEESKEIVNKDCQFIKVWNKKGKELTKEEYNKFRYNGKEISYFLNACSLVLHHINCLDQFLKTDNKYTIIIEDDAFISNCSLFVQTIQNATKIEFDTIFLGDGCQPDLYMNQSEGFKPTRYSRCTEAILYSRSGAQKIVDWFNKSQEYNLTCPQLDFFFNEILQIDQSFKNFHSHPAPISQGTCKGLLSTTIDIN